MSESVARFATVDNDELAGAAGGPATGRGTVRRMTTTQIRGEFEVTRHPEPPYETVDGIVLARSKFDKRFHGPLDATGTVDMIACGGPVQGSAGYVAMERVTGRVEGRTGTFVFQHSAAMDRGAPSLSITVVPDSGTGELTGIRGRFMIDIVDGKHRYTFDYAIAPPA